MTTDKETAGDTHCPNCGDPYLAIERDRHSTTIVHATKEHEQGGTTITEACTVAAGYDKVDDAEIPELFEEAHEAVAHLYGAVDNFRASQRISDARVELLDAQSNWEWNNGN